MSPRPLALALVAPLVSPIAEPFLGGSQALLFDLAQELAARGHAVTLFGADGSRVPGVEVARLGIQAETLRAASFSIVEHDAALRERERVSFLRIAYEIRRRADEFDVVHNHAFDAPAYELLCDAHPRIIHTLHLPPVLPTVVSAAAAAAERATMVTVSSFMVRAWAGAVHGLRLIRNGVPVARIPFHDRPGEGWLFVGRIAPEKGLEDALDAAELAGRRLRVVGGVYDATYHARLEARLERHEMLGALPRSGVFLEMAQAQGLLMPVKWDEPFGLAAAEAMAAGCPVAAYARGALPEVIGDRVGGYLVEDMRVESLATAAEAFGAIDRAACRTWAAEHFDLARMVDDYVTLYRELA
ncbi:MAG TPA: glycosyltransferase [Candidatus Limnocylindrales bacterium]|nr:glycosyltransferase [Candidatus Limnocylindrales bacterium]